MCLFSWASMGFSWIKLNFWDFQTALLHTYDLQFSLLVWDNLYRKLIVNFDKLKARFYKHAQSIEKCLRIFLQLISVSIFVKILEEKALKILRLENYVKETKENLENSLKKKNLEVKNLKAKVVVIDLKSIKWNSETRKVT